MKKFKHHNNGVFSSSYVLGNYCSNGCQFFHKDDAQEVFDKFYVPEKFRADIMGAFSDEEVPPVTLNMSYREKLFYINMFRLSDLVILARDPNDEIREALASTRHPEIMDILVHDESAAVLIDIAAYGTKEHLDILVHSKNYFVASLVAFRGHQEHLEILQHFPHWSTRAAVARFDVKHILDNLVHDSDKLVREEVVKHGHPDHLEILANDESPEIRKMVARQNCANTAVQTVKREPEERAKLFHTLIRKNPHLKTAVVE